MADFAIPEPTPIPMTSIAWLYWHIGSLPARLREIQLAMPTAAYTYAPEPPRAACATSARPVPRTQPPP